MNLTIRMILSIRGVQGCAVLGTYQYSLFEYLIRYSYTLECNRTRNYSVLSIEHNSSTFCYDCRGSRFLNNCHSCADIYKKQVQVLNVRYSTDGKVRPNSTGSSSYQSMFKFNQQNELVSGTATGFYDCRRSGIEP